MLNNIIKWLVIYFAIGLINLCIYYVRSRRYVEITNKFNRDNRIKIKYSDLFLLRFFFYPIGWVKDILDRIAVRGL